MRRWPLLIFAAAIVLGIGGAASYWTYLAQKEDLLKEAGQQISGATLAFVQAVNGIFRPAPAIGDALTDSGLWTAPPDERATLFFSAATGLVRHYGQINGVFVGYPDGRFLHIQDLTVPVDNPGSPVAPGTRLTGRVIDNPEEDRVGSWRVFDVPSGRWWSVEGLQTPYDPRERPWFRAAVEGGKPVWTEPYVFASSGTLGVTYAKPVYDEGGRLQGVIGVDLSLASLSQTLVATSKTVVKVADHVFATDLGNRVIGHPDFVLYRDQLDEDTNAFLARYREKGSFENVLTRRFADGEDVATVTVDGTEYMAAQAVLDPERAMPLRIYMARDLRSLLAGVTGAMYRNVVLVFVAVVVMGIIATYAVKLRVEITARQRAEADLVVARDAAEAATQAKSTFLATMSHEIRGPMNGVMSMAELLGVSRLNGEQRWMTRVIQDSANALLTIINDILDFSKIEAGKLDIERVPFSLSEVVNGTAALLVPKAEDKGLGLLVDIDPALADRRLGDPTRLRQILLNLTGNAVKFTGDGEIRITVAAAPDGAEDRLRFDVHDTGIGLTLEQLDRLFQAFVQADASTTRKYGGSGLGLSICKNLVALMGGQIGALSEHGSGSDFWFELPLEADGAALHPDTGIAPASVCLVGLADGAAAIAERYLRAGGISDVRRVSSLEAAATHEAGLWIVAASLPGLSGGALGGTGAQAVTLAVAGWRLEIAGLPATVRESAACILTLPLSMPALWRAAAISLGHDVAESDESWVRDDLTYAPPDIEDARAANALILVAEDNPTNQAVIRKLLATMGFACEIAENGRIALSRLERPGYGLLLTDFHMPEMDGFALTRAIRKQEAESGADRLPVIALTADAVAGTDRACLEAGMDEYLTKPIESRRLGKVLAEYLPAALALRRTGAVAGDAVGMPTPGATDWDPDIFDLAPLAGPQGTLDAEARSLIETAADSWAGIVLDVNAAIANQDAGGARNAAHALKGASLSLGANRLGRVASDIQDFIDAGDMDMAAAMADVLAPTLEEFRETVPRILGR